VPELAKPSLEYVVVKPPAEDRALCVRVERGEATPAEGDGAEVGEIVQRCVAAIKEHLGVAATVELLERNTLPRSGYKTNRVVDA
jgi:phenylacetate-coenzyme A ligase PaaK-like adenylate-forming protein